MLCSPDTVNPSAHTAIDAQRHVVDRISSAVHRGVSYDGRFVSGGARNQELDGDTRHRGSDLDRFGPSDRHNTLRPVSLVYCIEM